jgi:hypothetical protein
MAAKKKSAEAANIPTAAVQLSDQLTAALRTIGIGPTTFGVHYITHSSSRTRS